MKCRTVFVVFGLVSLTVSSPGLAGSGAPPYGAILAGAKRAKHHDGASNNGSCDYSDARNHGGWGWNAATRTACPPVSDQGYCDYSNAGSNDGWGWNPVTNQSCH